jgi:hypothetical protein
MFKFTNIAGGEVQVVQHLPTYQAQSPEFKPQYHDQKKKEKKSLISP